MLTVPPRLLALIPLAVGINLALGQFAAVTHLPVFLDTVGTILVAALAGPWPAVMTGVLSQVTFTAVTGNFTWIWFLPVQLVVAVYAGLIAQLGLFGTARSVAVAGLGLGVVAATVSWPISYFVFGGVTAGGVTVVTALLRFAGLPLGGAVYGASLSNDVIDKLITLLLVRAVLRSLPLRMAARYPMAARALGRT
jgi:energy-coupling factor transport system substrate-specific component